MRRSTTAILLLVACLSGAGEAAAQIPPPAPPPPPAPAAPVTTVTAPAVVVAPPAAPAPAPAPPPPPPEPAPAAAPAAPAAPAAAPAGNWWDKFSADAFVDAYGNVNWNTPKPQFNPAAIPTRAYDQAAGFSLNQVGVNASYSSDTVGGTVSLRFGPEAVLYNATSGNGNGAGDNTFGLQNVRQAYATLKATDQVTFDLGKWDQPFGSEVPDSQLNFFYTRSLLFQLNQPVFFTGLRFDYAPSSMVDLKLFAANGWNGSIDDNTSKTFGGQLMLKPMDSLIFYIGGAAGPEQPDFAPAAGMTAAGGVPGADSNWREIVDLVIDYNPTPQLSFALNGDFDTESNYFGSTGSESWYGVNLGIKYVVADPFAIAIRGEYFGDNHGRIFAPTLPIDAPSTSVESATLTLSYVVASHLTLMLDNRIDAAKDPIFATENTTSKTLFTTTLGAIIATK
jgi:hypothetical protein